MNVEPKNYADIESRLTSIGLELEKEQVMLSQKEADEMWFEHRNWMTSNRWDLHEYWNFIYREFPDSVRLHDMTCIATLAPKAESAKDDALGPRVMFMTVDGKLWRMRKRYPFICSPIQFLEFVLPYLFLSDIPVKDAKDFPNHLLSAQLGTLLVKRPPELTEIVKAYFRNPSLAKEDPYSAVANIGEDMARALSSQRFRHLVMESEQLTLEQREELGRQTAAMLEEVGQLKEKTEADAKRTSELESELKKRETTIERLQRKIGYWRSQARRK